MSIKTRLRALFALLAAALLAAGVAACGGDNDESSTGSTAAGLIQSNPDNSGVTVTVGSKNFTEQFILGQIYAQGLEAAGYNVKTKLNLGSETIALKAIKDGQISGYPEYTSTALGSFFHVEAGDDPVRRHRGVQPGEGGPRQGGPRSPIRRHRSPTRTRWARSPRLRTSWT